jgi:AcrR family transcriptional regulator
MPEQRPEGRGRRMHADDRRAELLRCAERLFAERPYASVSTTDIADAAGIARGLLNHYFGTKRELYLEVVRRAVAVPELEPAAASGSLKTRVERGVNWFLDAAESHGQTFLAVASAGPLADDPELEAVLAAADDEAASRVLEVLGLTGDDERLRAAVRAYGAFAKATLKEWQRTSSMSRQDAHRLLTVTLLAIAKELQSE